MSKREHLRGLVGNIAESMGVGVAPGNAPESAPPAPASLPGASRRMDGVTRPRNVAEIPVERISPDPDQPRTEFDDAAVARLAESLKSAGQLQPIRVRWDDARGSYMIIVGERRWRAAQLAGLPTLMAVVHEGPAAPGDLLSWQLVENALREDLSPVEQARAYRRLMDLNRWTGAQLARELAIDPASVTRALSLLELPAPVREMVESEALSPRTAYEVAKLASPEDQVAMAERVVAEGLTRDETAAAVRERPTRGERPARWRKSRVDLGAAGHVDLAVPASAPEGAEIALLKRAVKRLTSPDAGSGEKAAG